MYRVEKRVVDFQSAILVCAESREAALAAAHQVSFDTSVSWHVPGDRDKGKKELVPLTCADEPVPVVQVRQHAAARIEYIAYAKPPAPDAVAANNAQPVANGPLDVQHRDGHRYRMLGVFYAADDAKAYEVGGTLVARAPLVSPFHPTTIVCGLGS
jgi:hypothetical protein